MIDNQTPSPPTAITVEVPSAPHVTISTGGARGLSAYEIAVAAGFEGTEADWLESLRGTSAGLAEIDAAIAEHVQSPTPHPAYDDAPDLSLIFQNTQI